MSATLTEAGTHVSRPDRPKQGVQTQQTSHNRTLDATNTQRTASADANGWRRGGGAFQFIRPNSAKTSGGGLSVEKALIGLGFLVAVVMFSLFGVDLAFAWPLKLGTPLPEAVLASCGLALGYLSWNAYRYLR